ncbi:MAG: SEC-C metal-binding domain-containing protein, partial [Candidatus Saganbacteria bacterium]|nr:SEC-C metal-binding domain-containing protein [Candidatus Saganbacteria bacterium]
EPIAIEERRGAGKLVFRKDELGVFTPEMQAAAARAHRGADEEQGSAEPQAKQQPFRRQGPKVGPNAPCPCGSGKKYKKCCGRHE